MLFVPANRPKFVNAAHRRGADAIILDLEDSVPVAEKSAARLALRDAVPGVGSDGADVFVRVNKQFELLIEDADAAVQSKPVGLVFPKVESPDEVRILDALTAEREIRCGLPRGALEFMILIESPIGLERVSRIASASPRKTLLSLGMEDLSKNLEIDLTRPGYDLSWAHARIVLAARAHGLSPYGLIESVANIGDLDSLARIVTASRQFGYVGAVCIHPSQVPILNDGFSPSVGEIKEAREIVEAFERAEREGAGAPKTAPRKSYR